MADFLSPLLRGHLERASFKATAPLTASDLNLQHRHRMQLLRHHLRLLHGWGVVFGLRVVSVENVQRPWLIRVCPGYAISPCGDEIAVPEPVDYDLSDIEWGRQLAIPHAEVVYIGLRLLELPLRPMVIPGCGCECGGGGESRPSRAKDAVEVIAVWKIEPAANVQFDICSGETPLCPLCHPRCNMPLASVAIPGSTSEMITNDRINNSIRQDL